MRTLKTLVVADSLDDARAIRQRLSNGGLELDWEQVRTADSMDAALRSQAWDIVFSTTSAAGFSVGEALELIQGSGQDLPVIVLADSDAENEVTGALRSGAHDFVYRSDLSRVLPVVERELREANVRRENRKFADALRLAQFSLDRAGDSAYWLASAGSFVYANEAATNTLGYSQQELLTLNVRDINTAMTMEVWQVFWEDMRRRGIVRFEAMHRRSDGRTLPVEITANYVKLGDTELNCAFARDMSERKVLQDELVRAQKLEVIGRLAAAVAHDFANLMTPIMGFAELAMATMTRDHAALPDLRQVTNTGERELGVIRQLLTFSGPRVTKTVHIDLNDLIRNMDSLLRQIMGEGTEVTFHGGPDVGTVLADPGLLEQVLTNLAVNARDAMPEGGQLSITTSRFDLDKETAAAFSDIPPGRYARISVADTGVGVAADVRVHLFEPFFTTKPRDKGHGLGLTTCYGIVKQAGGEIRIESEVGKGTSLYIYLPFAAPAGNPTNAEEHVTDPESDTLPRGAETVLVAEDEPRVRLFTAAALRALGYNVLVASDEELDAWAKQLNASERIDLLLADVAMPQIDGLELASRLSKQQPDVCVLFTSGYAGEALEQYGLFEGDSHLLPKPFTYSELARKVREALDS